MGELNFNNSDFTKLRAGMSIGSDNIFLKKYDKDGNSIFDAEELNSLRCDLEAYAGEDRILDESEAMTLFAKVMNVSLEKVKEIFTTNSGNLVFDSVNHLYTQQARENATKQIKSEAVNALEIYNRSVGGDISRGWNNLKEVFNSKYTQDKVYRQIAGQYVSAMLLEKAEDRNITAKDYINTKIAFLKYLLGADKMSEADCSMIEKAIGKMTPKELDTLITKLKNADNNEYNNIVNDTLKDMASKTFRHADDGVGWNELPAPNSIAGILQSEMADKPMTYDDIFLLEHGTVFNAEQVNDYTQKEQEVKILTTIAYSVSKLNEHIDKQVEEKNYQEIANALYQALRTICGDNTQRMNELLSKYGAGPISFKNGEYVDLGVEETAIAELAKNIQKELNTKLDEFLGGKSLEDYNQELKTAYQDAYGYKNIVNLAEKFETSQQNGLMLAKTGAAIALGSAAIIAGGGVIMIVGQAALGATGIGLVSVHEARTKQGGMTDKDKENIKKEILTAFALGTAGGASAFGARKISNIACENFLKNCPLFKELLMTDGPEIAAGLLTDLAFTGEIDLTAEGISQLVNIAMGLIAHKKSSYYSKSHTQVETKNFSATRLKNASQADVENYVKSLASKRGTRLSNTEIEKIADNLYKLKKENGLLYRDIEESGILKLVEDGRIDFDTLQGLFVQSKNARMSPELMADCKKMINNEPFVKEYPATTDKAKILKETPNGDVVTIDSKLYINDDGKLVELNLSKEKYLELFPPFRRFDVNQNDAKTAGNCWFLETAQNLYTNPSTRIEILKSIKQVGNDIHIKFPGSNMTYKFQNGEVPTNKHDNQYYLSNSPKWMQMFEYAAAFERKFSEKGFNEQGLLARGVLKKDASGNKVLDINSYLFLDNISGHNAVLYNLYSGDTDAATKMLTGKTSKNIEFDKTHEMHPETWTKEQWAIREKQKQELRELLSELGTNSNYSAQIGLGNHAYAISRVENGRVYLKDPYNMKLEISISIEEAVENCRSFSIM